MFDNNRVTCAAGAAAIAVNLISQSLNTQQKLVQLLLPLFHTTQWFSFTDENHYETT